MSSISLGSAGTDAVFACASSLLTPEHSYTLDDPIGVELAGALKNVYAIASGIADGLGFENNTRASARHPLFSRSVYLTETSC